MCRVHGGASGQVKKKAKERLLELVDPALASLDKVLRDPKTDDSVKVRAATAILDRTGFRPGMVVTVEPDDKWSQLLNSATSEIDRSLPGSESQEQIERDRTENAVAVGEALRSEAWAEVDHEETREYRRGRIWPDENTVQGEVVDPPPPGDRGRWNEYEQRLRDDLGDDA